MIERIKHLPTTAAGLAAGAIVVSIFKSFGCQLPSDWIAWGAGFIAALPGILAKS